MSTDTDVRRLQCNHRRIDRLGKTTRSCSTIFRYAGRVSKSFTSENFAGHTTGVIPAMVDALSAVDDVFSRCAWRRENVLASLEPMEGFSSLPGTNKFLVI